MDRGARDRIVRRVGKGASALLLMALLLAAAGCHRYERRSPPPPAPGTEERAGDNTAATAPGWLPPAVAVDGTEGAEKPEATAVPPAGGTVRDNTAIAAPPAGGDRSPGAGEGRDASRVSGPPAAPAETPPPEAKAGAVATLPPGGVAQPMPSPPADAGPAGTGQATAAPSARKPAPAAAPPPAPPPPKDAHDASIPGWAKSPEELVYRVDFIGITMGYARFRYKGKVTIDGKPAYHLNVRAWTSGVLSYIYPINETIDYYLDAETIAPIRQEFTQRESAKDDVALYDQETGWITYRYRQTGEIRKRVETVPTVYDPVSVAYYFRWRDLGAEDRPRNVYGGRKLYQISSRILGYERISTDHGEVETIAVLPVIRRNGKPDSKGDLKVWFSRDPRRVPVRLYAKFHKIKDWTLVGELVPPTAKAGG